MVTAARERKPKIALTTRITLSPLTSLISVTLSLPALIKLIIVEAEL